MVENESCMFLRLSFFFFCLNSYVVISKLLGFVFFGTYVEQCYKVGSINCFLISYMDHHFCMLEHSIWLIGLDSDTYLAFIQHLKCSTFDFLMLKV